jgi:HTH-type transcriptional regulator / antitoxin HipB
MKVNWLWDTRLSETRVKGILKNEKDPRFYIYAEKLFSRVDDPKRAFGYVTKKIFFQQWPIIKRRIQKDAWGQGKIKFWQTLYDKNIDVSPERMSIAEQIKNIRNQMGCTQKELAKKLGVIQQYVSKLESGRENLTLDTLKRIAEVFGRQLIIEFTAP